MGIFSSNLIRVGTVAAILTGIFKVLDNLNVRHVFGVPEDPIVSSLTYLIAGSWTISAMTLVLAVTRGRRTDPEFKTLLQGGWDFHGRTAASGLLAATGTFCYFIGYQLGDPAALVPLTMAPMLFTAMYEHKLLKTKGVLWTLIGFFGAMLAGYTGVVQTTIESILLVLIAAGSLYAVSEIIEKSVVSKRDSRGQEVAPLSNAITFNFWRITYFALLGTGASLLYTALVGKTGILVRSILAVRWGWLLLILGLGCATLSNILGGILKKQEFVTPVLVTRSTQVVVAYALTFFAELVRPGVFGGLPNISVWSVRMLGTVFLITAIYYIKKVAEAANNPHC